MSLRIKIHSKHSLEAPIQILEDDVINITLYLITNGAFRTENYNLEVFL
jgi:hypothetical protein